MARPQAADATMRDMPDSPSPGTRLAKALSHPLRSRLLMAYTGRVASPSQVAAELHAPIGDVAYHTKRLQEHGLIELVEQVRGRGGIQHYYRARVPYEVSDAEWATLPGGLRQELARPVIASILDDVANAARDGGLAGGDVHLSRTRLELDEEARDELAGLLETVVDEARRLQEESAARRATGKREPSTALSILHIPTRVP
jgi:DNA-binding transcriptional ArsR family regulator